MSGYDAVILAGGRARRLQGLDKTSALVHGRPLLEVALAATAAAGTTVVVGPPRPTGRSVIWTREEPPGGGPVVALREGVRCCSGSTVVVLAADLPFLTAAQVETLVDAAPALAVDDEGRDQPLLAAYDGEALRAVLLAPPTSPEAPAPRSMRGLLEELPPARRLQLAGQPPPWFDCDTAEELQQARAWPAAGPRGNGPREKGSGEGS